MMKLPATHSLRSCSRHARIALFVVVALTLGTEASVVFGQNQGSFGGPGGFVGPAPFVNSPGGSPSRSLLFPSGIFPTGLTRHASLRRVTYMLL